MAFLLTSWGQLAYADHGGAGVATLFLHGTGCAAADWAGVLEELPAAVRPVTMDFRGHGSSDVPGAGFSLEDLADDALALLGHLRADSAWIVGHSLGGMVGLAAAQKSRAIAGLVLLEGWTSLRAAGAFVGERFHGRLDAERIATIRRQADGTRARFRPQDWTRFWESVQAFDATAFLAQTTIPIVEVYGAMGRAPEAERQLQVPNRPNIHWAWVPDAGHYLPHERPADVAAICQRSIVPTGR